MSATRVKSPGTTASPAQDTVHLAWWRRRSRQRAVGRFFVYLIIICGVVVVVLPLIWMLSTSLKANADVFIFPPEWIPNPALWGNYPTALTTIPFVAELWNTTIITAFTLVG